VNAAGEPATQSVFREAASGQAAKNTGLSMPLKSQLDRAPWFAPARMDEKFGQDRNSLPAPEYDDRRQGVAFSRFRIKFNPYENHIQTHGGTC